MKQLHIAHDLSLPIDVVTQKIAFLGRTGGGKTYAATKLAELMLEAKAQIVALDPVGKWYGLRIAADGKGKGFPIPVFGGLYGDLPLQPTAGALVADLIVDREISAVLDVSQFISSEQAKFATDFARRLFERRKRNPLAMHLFIEECQEFVPQNLPPSEKGSGNAKMMLHQFERLIKLGRNYGVGASLISQRPQEVNKKVLNMTEIMFAFQMTGPHEKKAIEAWVGDKGEDISVVQTLPKLEQGLAHVWSPVFLNVSRVFHISQKKTADVSATPKVGERAVAPKELSPVDVKQIEEAMAETIEKAKADDPKELKKQIAELKREAEKLKKDLPQVATKVERIEVPVITDEQLSRIQKLVDSLEELKVYSEMMRDALKEADDIRQFILEGVKRLRTQKESAAGLRKIFSAGFDMRVDKRQITNMLSTEQSRPKAARPAPPRNTEDVDGSLSKTQQRILDALAFYESIGIRTPTKLQVGAVAMIDPTGGYFGNTVGPLSTAGLVESFPGKLRLTDAGREHASIPETVGTLDDYHNVLRARVLKMKNASGRTIDMLNVIISRGGEPLTTEEIGREVGIDHTGGYFGNTIGPLGTVGLIERERGLVTPTEILFPPSLS